MRVSRVEDEVRPRPEQVGRQRDHDEPRLRAQVGLICQQRLMIYQLVESQVHRQGFHACGATRLKGVVELVDTEFNARL